jgi:hypothetical protein
MIRSEWRCCCWFRRGGGYVNVHVRRLDHRAATEMLLLLLLLMLLMLPLSLGPDQRGRLAHQGQHGGAFLELADRVGRALLLLELFGQVAATQCTKADKRGDYTTRLRRTCVNL